MLKLLLIAPTCDGHDVGEAWVAYQWVQHLAKRHAVTLVTYHKRGRTPASVQFPDLRVVEWAEPHGLGRAERLNSLLKPGYVPFYFRARHWIRSALARGESFDLAFQPVPVAMRYPSPAVGLGIPLVIGPVGGSLQSPPGFGDLEKDTPWYVQLRKLDTLRLRFDPLLSRTYREATCVLGIAPYVKRSLEHIPVRRFEVMSETGIEQLPPPTMRDRRERNVRLLFVGRIVPTKGAQYAIRALDQIRDVAASLDIVGDGFERIACEKLVSDLALSDRVRFHGWLSKSDVNSLYAAADIFVFPSYREPGGNVAFEAMSYGLPLIVSDIGGPGNVVDSTCGIKIHPSNARQYVHDLALAIRTLVEDAGLRHSLGDGARRRVEHIGLWESKAQRLEEILTEIL